MTHKVVFSERAERQLAGIDGWIAAASSPITARRFVGTIRRYCNHLSHFPDLGRSREDLYPGLRSISVERRTTIVYSVTDEVVEIIGVFYGGRDVMERIRHNED
ncbi:MAG: type II toxin-antitoxin system RelE/ParE family toxin [Thermomicrobiales bacterium]|nr:type II toxin-antitoxin system RelE/ParE family toxin [Thermomicrobiales bacterium]